MSDYTADGLRAATKITKVTKTTKTKWLFVIFVVFVICVLERVPWAVSRPAQQPPQTEAQQRPVFRGGTHFVRVDAYPSRDGKIVAGLKPEDFEILEDGKPQAIESFDFITFDTFASEAERHDPISQRAGFDMAADPRYRVFVVFVAMSLSNSSGPVAQVSDLDRIPQPLVDFFERVVGPRDLYGFLTSRNSAKDLVLAQKTGVTIQQLRDLKRANFLDRDDADRLLDTCNCPMGVPDEVCTGLIARLKVRFRADATYTTLTDLVAQLGSLRQERKNLLLTGNLLPRWREDQSLLLTRGQNMPRTGIVNGRITGDDRQAKTTISNGGDGRACTAEFQRLAMMDFEPRYWQLLSDARRENVAFYVITPGGLQAPPELSVRRAVQAGYDDLDRFAANTDGLAVTDTNDMNVVMRRIADDLAAYYLLGYYSTNTKFDGTLRKITVRMKANGQAVRARREYRAPTEAEIAAMSNPRPAVAAPVEAGPPAVIGEPAAYRVSRTQPPEKTGLLEFVRADRLRVEWPVLAPLDRREARLLDSAGKPLPIDLPVSGNADAKTVVVELPLAAFGRGVYTIELTAGSSGKTEQRRLTFTMK